MNTENSGRRNNLHCQVSILIDSHMASIPRSYDPLFIGRIICFEPEEFMSSDFFVC